MNIYALKSRLEAKIKNKDKHLSKEERDTIHRAYIDYHTIHNKDAIYSIAMEELAELTQQLSKVLRLKAEFNNTALLEEMADVEICIENLKVLMKTDNEQLEYIKDIKMQRIQEKIKKGDL